MKSFQYFYELLTEANDTPFAKRVNYIRRQEKDPLNVFKMLDTILPPHSYVGRYGHHSDVLKDLRDVKEMGDDATEVELKQVLDEYLDEVFETGKWYDDAQIPDRTNFDKILPWILKWIKSGDEKQINSLVENAQSIADWYSVARPDIHKYPPTKAIWHARRWHAQTGREQDAKAELADAANLNKVADLEGGVEIYELVPENLKAEGEAMKHCVGKVCSYADDLRAGKEKVFSVRRNGKREYTAQFQMDGDIGHLRQFKAKANRLAGVKSTDIDAAKKALAWFADQGHEVWTYDTRHVLDKEEEVD